MHAGPAAQLALSVRSSDCRPAAGYRYDRLSLAAITSITVIRAIQDQRPMHNYRLLQLLRSVTVLQNLKMLQIQVITNTLFRNQTTVYCTLW